LKCWGRRAASSLTLLTHLRRRFAGVASGALTSGSAVSPPDGGPTWPQLRPLLSSLVVPIATCARWQAAPRSRPSVQVVGAEQAVQCEPFPGIRRRAERTRAAFSLATISRRRRPGGCGPLPPPATIRQRILSHCAFCVRSVASLARSRQSAAFLRKSSGEFIRSGPIRAAYVRRVCLSARRRWSYPHAPGAPTRRRSSIQGAKLRSGIRSRAARWAPLKIA
jgi:hypothetical protein